MFTMLSVLGTDCMSGLTLKTDILRT